MVISQVVEVGSGSSGRQLNKAMVLRDATEESGEQSDGFGKTVL